MKRNWSFLALAVLVGPLVAAADTTIEHKFTEGDTVTYRADQDVISQVPMGGASMTTEMRQTSWTKRTVQSVDSSGAKIEEVIERMTLKTDITGGPVPMSISWDSEKPDEASGPNVEQVAAMLKPLVGQAYTYRVGTDGTISDIQISDDAKPSFAMAGGGDAETAARAFIQAGMLPVPGQSVSIGDSWPMETSLPNQMGTITVKGPLTLKSVSGDTAEITGDLDASIEAAAGSPMKVEVTDVSNKTSYMWDVSKGRVKSAESEMVMEIAIEVGGQKQNVTTTAKTSSRIVDGAGQ